MRRSKLDHYQDIISTLNKRVHSLDNLAFECNMDCITLNERLRFLVKNDVVKEVQGGNSGVLYSLTRRGIIISKTLRITKQLEKHQANSHPTEESLRTVSSLHDV